MSTAYQGTMHTKADTTHLVWHVADKVRDEELQIFKWNKRGNRKEVAICDILALGEQKL
jgi:hypothetical protein